MGCHCTKFLHLDNNELHVRANSMQDYSSNKTNNNLLKTTFIDKDLNNILNPYEPSEKTHNKAINDSEDYPTEMFLRINELRQNPLSVIPDIETGMKYITKITKENGIEKVIFHQQIKVALNRGENAFMEAIEDLKTRKSIPPLEFKPSLCIQMPTTEEEMKDKELLAKRVIELKSKENVDNGWKELVGIPDISFLLMVVGDSEKKAKIKRNDLLNPDYKYIGISSTKVGKNFLAYFMFSK